MCKWAPAVCQDSEQITSFLFSYARKDSLSDSGRDCRGGGEMIQTVFNPPHPHASSDRTAPLPYNFLLAPTLVLYLPDSFLTQHYLYKMPRNYYDASGSKQPSRIRSLRSSHELTVRAWPVRSGRQTLRFVISLPVLKQDAQHMETKNRRTTVPYNLVVVLSITWHCSCHKLMAETFSRK